ncbi:pyruvate dehydrogenase complex dihydrolipoamide acetyltransferase [Lichenicoccus roseus]|uniref:Acetyltransferase component of pyruvate dehydrogenase complex n=1 Tax=Lichenicoccus roseus TaxID=2683649 RepID=A0A5R9J8E2_9PROT|nr:pyruvate dehydrogenase complex dihydrolipoamide acetyltransferase [Lichenicoccus roseus]TLU73890.1 pyruvate dehydrogenase complex dihydrolipoamide acetyltransferase [Lichenicoccus roseus]
MSVNILMPALSPTMTEGTLARWLKKEGDAIASGDVIAEIETDKATMEVEAVDEGILGRILVADGTEGVQVNQPIGIIVDDGEAVPDAAAPAAKSKPPVPAAEASNPTQPPAPVTHEAAPAAPAAAAAPAAGGRVFISPLAKRLAKEAGLDPASIPGSGPNGRIIRADVEAAQKAGPATKAPEAKAPAAAPASAALAAAPTPARPAPVPITAPHTKIPNSNVRRVIARRLSEAKQFIPHFYVSIDVELDRLLALRTELNASSPKEGPGTFKLSVNDMLIKAAAVTLRRVPRVNASYTDEAIIQYDDVDIAVAVSIPDGLITPIVTRADVKSLSMISNEAKALIKRARDGKLKPEEFQGGSFSISNMGMFGVKSFSAILNPPQGAILAVAAGEKRAVVRSGDRIEVANVMTCTLSVDHRVIDGALAAEWMSVFKSVVESPMSLVV